MKERDPGVWVLDASTSAVSFRPVQITEFGGESVILGGGVRVGETIVALGGHFLHEGQSVRSIDGPGGPGSQRSGGTPMMGFNLSALAVRERAITLFLIVAVILSGAYAFLASVAPRIPASPIKVLTVSAVWPGATAQEMQDLVADPLEKRMQELRWYDHVETFTRPGLA